MNGELTLPQRNALAFVMADPFLKDFYLSGGTALAAYYLHHRTSDDLDFFTANEINGMAIDAAVQRLRDRVRAIDVTYQKMHDRRLYILRFDEPIPALKVESTYYPFKQLEAVRIFDGARTDSLRDCAANKLMALLDRFDPKDFVDLYALTRGRRLQDIRVDAQSKFGVKINPLTLGSELMKVDRIVALPKMIKPLGVDELKRHIHQLAKELRGEIVEG